ncbi:MAG: hypothetical protein M3N26_06085 [Pseudomonadota bacterium]|nr:hypothetical protein [Pseudomonadota bacterium]
MADETDAPAPESPNKRLLILAGAGAAGIVMLSAVLAVVTWKVEPVHALWCKRVGLLCAKPTAVVAVAAVVKPAGCPDRKMKGALRARGPNGAIMTVASEVSGQVTVDRGGWVASGSSDVTCTDTAFLASFTKMSQGLTYQCMGSIDGKAYAGVCNLSDGAPDDIAGEFTN